MKHYPLARPCNCVFYDIRHQECDFELWSKYLSPERIPFNCPRKLSRRASTLRNRTIILEAIKRLKKPSTANLWKEVQNELNCSYEYFVAFLAYLAKTKLIRKELRVWRIID